MILKIIRPGGHKQHQIIWLEINTPTGNFVIAKGHAPMIVTLSKKKQIVFELATGQELSEIVSGGIAHILRDEIQLLLET